jgi:hypothetical protein
MCHVLGASFNHGFNHGGAKTDESCNMMARPWATRDRAKVAHGIGRAASWNEET